MKYLLYPFYALWTIWCAIVFFLLAFAMFPFLYVGVTFGGPKTLRAMHYLPCYVAQIALFLWGVRIVEHHKERIDKNRQLIFVGNHRSYLDALISGQVIKNYKKYIGKAEVLKWPVLGYLLDKLYIPVQRDNKDYRAWSMEQLYVKAKEGASIVIFPEGTSNNTNKLLKHFHDGAFRLAIPTKIPIAVFTIIGAGEIWHRDTLLIKPGKVEVYWSEIIEMDSYESIEKDMDKLKERVIQTMLPILEKHYPNGYEV